MAQKIHQTQMVRVIQITQIKTTATHPALHPVMVEVTLAADLEVP
jgi:hypothetical protein